MVMINAFPGYLHLHYNHFVGEEGEHHLAFHCFFFVLFFLTFVLSVANCLLFMLVSFVDYVLVL